MGCHKADECKWAANNACENNLTNEIVIGDKDWDNCKKLIYIPIHKRKMPSAKLSATRGGLD